MSVNRYLSLKIQAQIRQRANNLCEYCHTAEQWQYIPFTIWVKGDRHILLV